MSLVNSEAERLCISESYWLPNHLKIKTLSLFLLESMKHICTLHSCAIRTLFHYIAYNYMDCIGDVSGQNLTLIDSPGLGQ